MMIYKCTAHIEYEVMVTAETAELAATRVFETIGETVLDGVIPLDLFESPEELKINPFLVRVDTTPISECNGGTPC